MCERVGSLLNVWRSRACVTDKNRRIPPETISELHDGSLLQILAPKRYGGLEMDWPTAVEVSRIAARACASTAWIIGVLGGHIATVGRLSKACQDSIFAGGPRQLIATASISATGTLVKEEGGFRLNGLWRFSSGIDYATWLIISARCENHPNPPTPNIFKIIVRQEQVHIEDDWYVSGMRGTGSKDIRFDDMFVSDRWVIARSDCFDAQPAGAEVNPGSYLYDVPFIPYSTSWVIGPILGCAEGAYDDCLTATRNRMGAGVGAALIDLSSIYERLAESSAELSCARHLYDSIVTTLHDAGVARRALSEPELLTVKRDRAYLTRLCVNAIQRLVRHMGATMSFDNHPVQQHWRDLQVMSSHMDLSWDSAMPAYGKHALGELEKTKPN